MSDIFWKFLAAVLTAVLPIVAGFLCDLIRKLAAEAAVAAKNEKTEALITEIGDAVRSAVVYVNQTFVDELKKQDAFDEDSAKKAFETAFQVTVETISHEAETYIEETFGDLRRYLEVRIEETVRDVKKWG